MKHRVEDGSLIDLYEVLGVSVADLVIDDVKELVGKLPGFREFERARLVSNIYIIVAGKCLIKAAQGANDEIERNPKLDAERVRAEFEVALSSVYDLVHKIIGSGSTPTTTKH